MTTYIDPISLLPPRFGELYSDRNILLSGQASWGGIATPLLTTQGVSILVTPKGGGALSVCLLPNQTYALPVDGYTVWVKLNRSPGVHTLLFGTDVLIYDNVSIPTPSQDWLPAFTRFNDKCYAHGGFVIPSILTQIGLAKNSDYEIVVGSATDPRTTYTSLAQAVQDAQSGWSILVLSGTYSFAAPAQGGIDAQSALAWTGKTLYITGEGHSTVIQNTGSLTRAFGIQNSTGSIVKNITLQNFPQAVQFDASSDSILELWQAVAAGYTDPTYINASQNNQVNLNIESAGLSPSSQVRKYIIGGSSYYLDASGNFVFTGVGNFTGSSVTFSAATPVFVKSLSGTQNAVVTDASNQLRSLLYGDFNAPLALVQRDSIGRFSAFNAQFSALSINQAVVTDGFGYLASLAYRVGQSGVDGFNAGDTGANTLVKRGTDGTINGWNVLVYNTLLAGGDSYISPYTTPSSLDFIYGYTTAESILVKAIAVNDLANQLQIIPDHIKSHTGSGGSDTGDDIYWSWNNPHPGYLTPWANSSPDVALSCGGLLAFGNVEADNNNVTYGIGNNGASNYVLSPARAYLQDGMLCGNYPGFIALPTASNSPDIGTQTFNSGLGGTIKTRDGGYAIQFAVRNTIGGSGSHVDGEFLAANQWALSIYVTEITTGRCGRFISFVMNEDKNQNEVGFGSTAAFPQNPGFGTPGSQNFRLGDHKGVQINL